MDRLKSRKFWMAAISALVLIGNDGLGLNLPSESIMSVAGIVAAYVLGQGAADARNAGQ